MAKTQGKATDKKSSKKMGRPPKMNVKIFGDVCKEIESSIIGLNKICVKYNSSAGAFFDLMDGDESGKLTEQYTRARERQVEYFNDLKIEIVFNRDQDHTPFTGTNVIQRDKLIIDTLKWQQSKVKPKKYGDKLDLTTDGEKISPVQIFQLPDNKRDDGKEG